MKFIKYIFLCFIFFVVLPAQLNSQVVEIPWYRLYAGSDTEIGFGVGVVVSDNGDIYTTGWSFDWDTVEFGNPLLPLNGLSPDVFVAKWNRKGNLVWYTFLGGDNGDYGMGIDIDKNGNVIVSGYSYSNWNSSKYGSPVIPHNNPGSNADMFVAKLNSSGKLQWHTFLGSDTYYERSSDVKVSNSGNIFIAGESYGAWSTAVYGNPIHDFNTTLSYSGDITVAKLNPSGVLQWYTFIGSDNYDYCYGLALSGAESVYVVGDTLQYWPVGDFGQPVTDKVVDDIYDGFIAKLNGAGAFQWYSFFGEAFSALPNSVDVSSSGNVFITGVYMNDLAGPVSKSSGLKRSSSGLFRGHKRIDEFNLVKSVVKEQFPDKKNIGFLDVKAFVISFSPAGEKNWFKLPNIDNFSHGIGIDVGEDGFLYITGGASDSGGLIPPNIDKASNGIFPEYYGFVLKMDTSGYKEWLKKIDKMSLGGGIDLKALKNGVVFVAGHSFGYFFITGSESGLDKKSEVLDTNSYLLRLDQYYITNVKVKNSGGSVEKESYWTRPGETCNVNIIPDEGYEIDKIIDNGTEVVGVSPYLITGIYEDHELEIYFRLIQYPPELFLTGERKDDGAWIVKKEYGELTITIKEDEVSPMEISAYILYKEVDGNWVELKRFYEAGTFTYRDKFLVTGVTAKYKLTALDKNGFVAAESEVLILD